MGAARWRVISLPEICWRAVETAGWSWSEGRAIAHAIYAYLAGELPPEMGRAHRPVGPDLGSRSATDRA